MESSNSTWLVFGATGQTGRHFVTIALEAGHQVKALARNPEKAQRQHDNLEWIQGSVTDDLDLDELLRGVDVVVCMLGDARQQQVRPINTEFIRKMVPAMRRQGVKRLLYQAGGFTRPYQERLPLITWILKNTVARRAGLLGQHRDNEAVIEYLVEEAQDIEWMVHRACILSDGPTKGSLTRDRKRFSLATFQDCAAYNYRMVQDDSAIHTCDLSFYGK